MPETKLTAPARRRYALGMIIDDTVSDGRRPTERLLALIDAFLAERRISEGTFGSYVMNDGKFLDRLRRGGSVDVDRVPRILRAIRDWDAVKAEVAADKAAAKAKRLAPARRRGKGSAKP